MASKNPADNKRKLSKNLREMKFMKRGALKEEQEQREAEELQAIDDEHWVLDGAEILQPKTGYIEEQSYTVCCELRSGRQSYGGFNPEIEKLMRLTATEICDIKDDDDDDAQMEKTIGDEEMAEIYGSLSHTIGKKLKKKNKRKGDEDDDDDEDNEPAAKSAKKSKKKKFLKPQD